MPTKLARHGRVKGYRPTYCQLQEIIEVAQKDFSDASETHMFYSQGDFKITPTQADKGKILPGHIEEIIKEAGSPDEFNNLVFSISQDVPMQKVEVHVGFGDWTTYRVESDDQTWAYGRYYELTDKLLSDRSLYAKFRASQPEILKEGTDNKWRTTSWEVAKDWRELSMAVATSFPWWPLVASGVFGFTIVVYVASPGNSAIDIQDHKQALQDVHDLHAHASALIVLVTLYIITLYAYRRWLATWLRSKVVLKEPLVMPQFSFRSRKSDAVGLASFYVAAFTLIVAVVTIIIT
jgi:hypothetical protein